MNSATSTRVCGLALALVGGAFLLAGCGESADRARTLAADPPVSLRARFLVQMTLPPPQVKTSVYIVEVRGRRTSTRLLASDVDGRERSQWSPDRRLVLVERIVRGRRDLWSFAADGSRRAPRLSGDGWETNATWSPNGRFIAYRLTRRGWDGRSDLYVTDARAPKPPRSRRRMGLRVVAAGSTAVRAGRGGGPPPSSSNPSPISSGASA